MNIVQPDGWASPKGYSNGIVATGRFLAIAGQIGWNERSEFVSDDFAAQAAQALRNVLAVLAAAGGQPEHVVRMTWYVTDKQQYIAASRDLGTTYRELFGSHYPAMTLVEVKGLLEPRAIVEIEATAVLP
jgi:enamine deaminase RidA (YjgF/YER057c/UK114 family)